MIIESPLAFLQMQVEGVRRDSIELLKSAFSKTPEALNAVNVCRPSGELIRPMCALEQSTRRHQKLVNLVQSNEPEGEISTPRFSNVCNSGLAFALQ